MSQVPPRGFPCSSSVSLTMENASQHFFNWSPVEACDGDLKFYASQRNGFAERNQFLDFDRRAVDEGLRASAILRPACQDRR